MSLSICGQHRSRSACAFAQSDQGLRCPQSESFDTKECFNEEQKPGRDFAHVQDYLNPHVLHMFEGSFSFDAAQFSMVTS